MNEQTPPYYPENIPYQPPPQGTPSSPEQPPAHSTPSFPGEQTVPVQPASGNQQQTMAPPSGQPGYGPAQPHYSNPAVYYPPTAAPQDRGDQNVSMAVAGFTLSLTTLLFILFMFIPGVAIILGITIPILGIVLSALGRSSTSRRTLATIGLVLSSIGTILYLGLMILILL